MGIKEGTEGEAEVLQVNPVPGLHRISPWVPKHECPAGISAELLALPCLGLPCPGEVTGMGIPQALGPVQGLAGSRRAKSCISAGRMQDAGRGLRHHGRMLLGWKLGKGLLCQGGVVMCCCGEGATHPGRSRAQLQRRGQAPSPLPPSKATPPGGNNP